ncbi:MAG: hypothetical protein M1837_000137 [Sclerophora amabilis]|nr:MAG: hypothetical protein M1837_000137 [Sclerophora amabilis]
MLSFALLFKAVLDVFHFCCPLQLPLYYASDIRPVPKAIATQFAHAGAKIVIISGRSSAPLEETKSIIETAAPGCTVLPVSVDVVDKSSVQSLFDNLPNTPDVLVNNAGVSLSQNTIVDSNINVWWSDWETNIKGLYLCTRAYLRALAENPGVILNVSSSVADMVSPNISSYGTSKLAVNRSTEFVHLEHANQDVRCIAFHPGGIAETGMGQKAPEQFSALASTTPVII